MNKEQRLELMIGIAGVCISFLMMFCGIYPILVEHDMKTNGPKTVKLYNRHTGEMYRFLPPHH